MKEFEKIIWVLIWIICLLFTCGLQVFIGQWQLEEYFNSKAIANTTFWSWAGSIVLSYYIYSHYSFLINIAPGSVFWRISQDLI